MTKSRIKKPYIVHFRRTFYYDEIDDRNCIKLVNYDITRVTKIMPEKNENSAF